MVCKCIVCVCVFMEMFIFLDVLFCKMSNFLKCCCDLMFSFKSPTSHKIRCIWSLVLINDKKTCHNISETWIGFKRKHLLLLQKELSTFFRKHNENVCFRNVFIQSSINLKITYILSLYRPDEDQYSKFVDNYQVFLKIFVDFLFFSQRPLKNLFVAQYMKNLFFLMYREFFKKQKENVL